MLGKTTLFQQKLLKSLSRSSRSNEGITLLESLVAIIVLTIAISVVTPPIFLAVATRVQNRKAEQAMHLAQKYTDRIRGIVEQGEYNDSQLPKKTDTSKDKPIEVPAPSAFFKEDSSEVIDSSSDCSDDFSNFNFDSMPAANEAMKVDVNGDCEADFFVQIFRSNLEKSKPISDDENLITAFPMGVRVYSRAAEDNLGSLKTEEASLAPTQGFGDQTKKPLATIYTNVIYSQDKDGQSLKWFCELEDSDNDCSDIFD
jgi:type II secretory pathway pseudopilin PulG